MEQRTFDARPVRKNPTPKMLDLLKDEAQKKERKLVSMYERWKIQARESRKRLKMDLSESELSFLVETLEKERDAIMSTYLQIRDHITVSTELRRCVDACDAVTTDIRKIAYERLTGIDGDFDAEQAQRPLKDLLKRSCAHSIYGSTVSRMSCRSSTSQYSKCVDAAADLAAKEAEYDALLMEKKQREKILHLEEQQRRQLEAERCELERLQAEKDVKAAHARLQVYSLEAANEVNFPPSNSPEVRHHASSTVSRQEPNVSPEANVSTLARALQDSMSLNRLPVPEPSVFNGNPIQFLEWKASF
ncbi:GRB10-interacting GYF protein 2-like [Xyrichtys novacula]|uniref:GRB10-interacting GYF protein 2-like n=1 Tax=Xyrichtys novacula TaxID=13765 RepID=A0AAV1FZ22_XYRNO|nr:GRB10-interacting GYF protein 2-like [Xyrichtys novacula]